MKNGYLINDEVVIYAETEYAAIKTYVTNSGKAVFSVERVGK